jgi:hypothetical protein
MSWARQYARNGAKLLDEQFPGWAEGEKEALEPGNQHNALAVVRVKASQLGLDVYGGEHNWKIAHGFHHTNNASDEQLSQAWYEQLRERIELSRDWKADMGIIEDEIVEGEIPTDTLYIVLNGPFSVGLVTENEEEAESWVSAIASVGQECAIVEKKVGKA